MESFIGDLGEMWPVYALFITSGLIIYAVFSWVGEALIGQILSNKTSVFGRSDDRNARARTIYVPPAQITTTAKPTSEKPKGVSLPSIPARPPVKY